MTALNIVCLIIAVSAAINIIYIIAAFSVKSEEMKISGFIMLFTPPAGIIYYFGQFVARSLSRRERNIALDEIGFSKERRNRILEPDVEREMQSVPLEELFLVSGDAEKRKRLLSELKKGYISSYSTIMKAFDNDDPETSHYAAAAITNAKAGYENDIREMDNKYGRDANNAQLIREYSSYVFSYLRSGILDAMEMKKYSFLYLNLMSALSNLEAVLSDDDYARVVDESIFVGDYVSAQHWAETALNNAESEQNYLNQLKVYYYTSRSEKFFDALELLKKSDISLTENGLSLIRFFIKAAKS